MTERVRSTSRAVTRATLLTVALGLPILFAVLFKDWALYVDDIRVWFATIGMAAPVIFTLAAGILTALGVPRLIFCALGGMLFGFGWGFVWSHLGTVLGAYAAFVVARWTARDYLLNRYKGLRALSTKVEGSGWWSVILVRQMPISGLYNDILLALSPVRHSAFWIGTTLGFLPLGVTATLVGAGLMQAEIAEITTYLASATAAFLALSLGWNWLVSRARRPGFRY
jgi:uncharacterized membrane protein YdjX (TVP38/TMEM64 family)